VSVNSNVAALAVRRSLLNNTREMATSMQRLNTGVRINSAADDAAGVSIAARMGSQIKSYGMAIRNAGDAISMLETAEGGLGAIADTLQRMRVLATTAANGTTVTTDRQALTDEVDQLKAEINRIAGVVKFNGISLLDGTFTNAKFQVGAMGGETVTVGIQSAKATDIGELNSVNVTVPIVLTGPAVPVAQTVTLTVQGVTPQTFSLGTFAPGAIDLAAAINASTSQTHLTATPLANSVTTTQTNTTATLNALEPPILATVNGVGIDIPVTPINPALSSAQKDNALRDNFITAFNARKASGVGALQNIVATNTGTGISLQNVTPATISGQSASLPSVPFVPASISGQAQSFPSGVFASGNTTLTINGVNIAVNTTDDAAANRSATVAAINAQTGTTGVTAVNDGASGVRLTSSSSFTTAFVSSDATVDGTNLTSAEAAKALGLGALGQTANPSGVFNAGVTQFTINGTTISVNTTNNATNNRAAAVAAINAQTAVTGVTAINDGATGVRLTSAANITTAFVSTAANIDGTVLTAAQAAKAFGLANFGTTATAGGNLTVSYSGPTGSAAANFGLPLTAGTLNSIAGTSSNSAGSYAALDPYVEFSVNGVSFEVNVTNFSTSMTTAQRNAALRADFVNAFTAKKALGPSALDGITASSTGTGVDIRALDGRTLTVLYNSGPAGTSAENFGVGTTPTYGQASRVNINYIAPDGVFGDITFSASTGLVPPGLPPSGITGTSVQDVDLTDQFFANYAMEWIDAAIEQVANYRANVGSALNRFGMTISNLRHTVENLEASRSRVRDTDFATEYSSVAKKRVLLESGMTVLQKATYSPKNILQLVDAATGR
jgi:flagellin